MHTMRNCNRYNLLLRGGLEPFQVLERLNCGLGTRPTSYIHVADFYSKCYLASMADWKKLSNKAKAAAMDWYGIPHSFKPRETKPRMDHADLEKHVVRAVSELLAIHPKVLFGVRQNSGGASYEAKSGKFAPIFFYHILTSQPVTITDFWGIMRDGRMFALEAKRPSWKEPKEEREFKQAAFLMLVRNCGGIAGFVRSSEEANALLMA